MSRYQSEYLEGQANMDFWREVFEGRKIVEVVFDEESCLDHLLLDNGEKVWIADDCTFSISDDESTDEEIEEFTEPVDDAEECVNGSDQEDGED